LGVDADSVPDVAPLPSLVTKESHLDRLRPTLRAVVVSTINEKKEILFSEAVPADRSEFTLTQIKRVLEAQELAEKPLARVVYTDNVAKMAKG
jgi:hypothetical protein